VFHLEISVETVGYDLLVVNMVGNIAEGFVFRDVFKNIFVVVFKNGSLLARVKLLFQLVVFVGNQYIFIIPVAHADVIFGFGGNNNLQFVFFHVVII